MEKDYLVNVTQIVLNPIKTMFTKPYGYLSFSLSNMKYIETCL